MDRTIFPSQLSENASVMVPPSKSLSHRALIAASCAQGDSLLDNLNENADTEATVRVLRHLGVTFENTSAGLVVHGTGKLQYDGEILDCGESGSTLRFMIPSAATLAEKVRFTGHGRLMKRPQTVYENIFASHHLLFQMKNDVLTVQGPLPSDDYQLDGNVSSQFITGMLFALPQLGNDSILTIRQPFESKSYVGLTTDILKKAGIRIDAEGAYYHISGRQKYHPFHYHVEGDDSQAAFLAVLALIHQQPLELKGISHSSRQGDHVIYHILEQAGGRIKETDDGYEIVPGELHGTTIDLSDCPDLGPVLFAFATQCEGKTVFTNAGRLRIKESDRIAAMEEELQKMGCVMTSEGETVTVEGRTSVHAGSKLDGHNDHRIVMALSVLSSIADGPCMIHGAEAVRKSWPSFFTDLGKTGITSK